MTRVVWTPEAISRLDDIEAHIALDSPNNAKEMIVTILTVMHYRQLLPRRARVR